MNACSGLESIFFFLVIAIEIIVYHMTQLCTFIFEWLFQTQTKKIRTILHIEIIVSLKFLSVRYKVLKKSITVNDLRNTG